MARPLLRDVNEVCRQIMDGELDKDLDAIAQACKARVKDRFRPRTPIRLTGTKNPDLEGQEGVIVKANSKTVTVGIGKATTDQWGTTYEGGEWNVSPQLIETLTPATPPGVGA